MIDFIILFFICRKIGRIAKEKGLGPIKWQLLTVLSWIVFEGIGFNIALGWLGYEKINSITELISILSHNSGVVLFSLFCAFGGYLLVRFFLERKEPKDNVS
jgi:hypothetical protein